MDSIVFLNKVSVYSSLIAHFHIKLKDNGTSEVTWLWTSSEPFYLFKTIINKIKIIKDWHSKEYKAEIKKNFRSKKCTLHNAHICMYMNLAKIILGELKDI